MSEQQLLLGVRESNILSFDNFYVPGNEQVVDYLQKSLRGEGEWFSYLWGAEGSGRSHLLQAICNLASDMGLQSSYIPCREVKALDARALLEGLESFSMICIDDVDQIVGDSRWEEQLFHLYNRAQTTEARLCVTASCAPRLLQLNLKDLRSRLSAGVCFQLPTPDDEMKMNVLHCHAQARKMLIGEGVLKYLLHQCSRDLSTLCELLLELDLLSLKQGRALTIPFVKQFLADKGH